MTKTYRNTIALSILTTLTLGTSCTMEEGGFDASEAEDESSGTTTDDEGDDESEHWRSAGSALGSALGSPVTTGTTVGKTNSFAAPCGSSNSTPDVWHSWTAPTAGTYVFTTANTTINSTFDTILHIRPVSNSSQVLGCNDDTAGLGLKSKVSLALAQGAELIIVVDGYGNATGSYNLNITKTCPNGICDNGENVSTCPQDCSCQPQACQPGQCGSVPNGCGGMNWCGACCVPDDYCQPGQCGYVSDGCGGSHYCPCNCSGLGYQGVCSGGSGTCCNSPADCTPEMCQYF